MKLYISYYGNYIAIVEGIYKKDKFNIKNTTFISSSDIKIDSNDKYSLLREALKTINTKTKNVVFLLNTRDVIIKSNQMGRIEPKDLDGIMKNEIYEMMSLHDEQYTFSYEVTNEGILDDKEVIDIVMAAISNEELETILSIFKAHKLNVERIDTMSTSYGRLLNNVEYNDIMMLNIGSYGSSVNIYKQDSLFIHDNIPVKINETSNYHVSLALVDEVKGLTNFYSSRNFGKTVDTIVLVGESNDNTYVRQSFEESFSSNLVIGIEELFDIENDIMGDLQHQEISKVCDILGSMIIPKYNNKEYAYMNLLPLNLRNKQNKQDKLKQGLIIVPVTLALLSAPYFAFNVLENQANKNVVIAQGKLDEILEQHKDIDNINNQIKNIEDEIGIYDMLSSKSINWGHILSSIDKNIPYRVDLTKIDVQYDSELANDSSDSIEGEVQEGQSQEDQEQSTEEIVEMPIYDQIPNVINIEGIAQTPKRIGEFVYSLNKLQHFESVKLTKSAEDKENGGHTFSIVLVLKEGVVSSG